MSTNPHCAPGGEHCTNCRGTHNPRPGVTFETSRTWGPADDDLDDEDED